MSEKWEPAFRKYMVVIAKGEGICHVPVVDAASYDALVAEIERLERVAETGAGLGDNDLARMLYERGWRGYLSKDRSTPADDVYLQNQL